MTNPSKRAATPSLSNSITEIPFGYCRCGCGRKTKLRKYNRGADFRKGDPLPFVLGHQRCVDPISRFWSRVVKLPEPDGCWMYGGLKAHHYGNLAIHCQPIYSHRLSFIIHYGSIPDGKHVLHTCDNPPCVRPDHLFLGTQVDNNLDRDIKGRLFKKLTHEDARKIIAFHRNGTSVKELAKNFKVSGTMIGYIVRGVWHKCAHMPALEPAS